MGVELSVRKEAFLFEQDYPLKRYPKISPGWGVSGRKALLRRLFNILEYQSHRLEELQKKESYY